MNKVVCTAVFLLLFIGLYARQELKLPLVTGICLMENESYKKSFPPGKITIGFEVLDDTLYKISFKDRVVDAGQLQTGFHTFAIPSPDFFRKTDTHRLLLECKSGKIVAVKEILIDIHLIPLYLVQKGGEEGKQPVYTLSLLIGNRLVYSTRKFAPKDISFELKLPPWDARYDPFGLIDDVPKPVSGVSILGAAASLYYLAKYLISPEETDNEDFVPQKKQHIETTFLKTNSAGDLWQWRALLSITAKDLGIS